MKNLYRRGGLKLFEENLVKLSEAAETCENHADREAIKDILCVPERKVVYDRTFRIIGLINRLESDTSIGPVRGDDKAVRNQPPRFWAGFAVLLLLLIILAATLVTQSRTDDIEIIPLADEPDRDIEPAEANLTETWQRPYHVTTGTLNVRSAPGIYGNVVSRVDRFNDLQVEFPHQNDGWAKVTTEDGTEGYVSINFIALGEGATAYRKYCSQSVTRPDTGDVFQEPGDGRHSLNLEAPASSDVAAKLVNQQGQTVFSGYVRARESHIFDDIPSGFYRLRFALGTSFSADCGLFTDTMTLHESGRTVHFDSRLMDSDYVYSELRIFFREQPVPGY